MQGLFAPTDALSVKGLDSAEVEALHYEAPEGREAALYSIELLSKEQPQDAVRVSVPVPENFKHEGLAAQLLDTESDEARAAGHPTTKELDGELKESRYVFETDKLGLFALVGDPAVEPDEPEQASEPADEAASGQDEGQDPAEDPESAAELAEQGDMAAVVESVTGALRKVERMAPMAAGDEGEDDADKGYLTFKVDWQDFDDVYGIRPAQVTATATVTPRNKAAVNVEFTVGAEDGWTKKVEIPGYTPDELKSGYCSWSISDVSAPMYDAYSYRTGDSLNSTRTLTLKPTMNRTSFTGQVLWDDNNDTALTRPDKVSYTVTYADGSPVPISGMNPSTNATYTSGTRPADFSPRTSQIYLPTYLPDGTKAQYAITLDPLPANYTVEDVTSSPSSAEHKFQATLDSVDYTVDVKWVDNNNERAQRPATVDLTLYANGEPYALRQNASVTVSATGNTYTWPGLPRTDSEGNPIAWSVRESPLTIHDTTYSATSEPDSDGVIRSTVTNVLRDDWNYTIDLKWDTAVVAERYDRKVTTIGNDTYTQKYSLDISVNSRSYEPGEMEVRMPYALWKNRDGSYNVPRDQDIGVPQAPATNPQYSYNYVIDKHGTDDQTKWEIVYTNWKKLEAGTNETITVIYTAKPANTIDMTKAVLTATGRAKGDGQADYEELASPTITFQMDTGAELTQFTKRGGSPNGSVDASRVYSKSNITAYSAVTLDKIDLDIDHYNYVQYEIVETVYNNQPYKLVVTDELEEGAELVAWWEPNREGNPRASFTQEGNKLTWTYDNTTSYIRFLVRYPRDPNAAYTDDDPTIYHNSARGEVFAKDDDNYLHPETGDQNDNNALTSKVDITWHDYEFSYGYIYANNKQWGDRSQYGVTSLEMGKDVTTSGATVRSAVNGYDLGEFQVDIADEDLFWCYNSPTGYTSYKRMTSEDYEIAGGSVQVNYHDVDRRTGQNINTPNLTTKPLEFYARTDRDGEWVKIYEFKLSQTSTVTYPTIPSDLLTGKGYTGLRLVTPDDLTAHIEFYFHPTFKLKASSPTLKEWFAQEQEGQFDITQIYLQNVASIKINRKNDDGESYLYNVGSRDQNQAARDLGVYDLNKAEQGLDIQHYNAVYTLGEASYSNDVGKQTVSYTNDTSHSLVDVVFDAAVSQSGSGTADLYEAAYDELLMKTGTFYDLLPKGYTFKPEAGVKARSANDRPAMVTSTEVIDDWRGTGRQMLIFKVKSTAGENGNVGTAVNWISARSGSNYRDFSTNYSGGFMTGFSIEYTAQVSWADLTFNSAGYNHVVFKKDDTPFRGSDPRYRYNTPYEDDGSIADALYSDEAKDLGGTEAARRILADIDDDGDTEGEYIKYSSSYVSPRIAQAIEVGIKKEVKGVSANYAADDRAAVGSQYRYRLSLTTSDNGITEDVVLYDVLEDAENTEGHSGEVPWKGTYASASTSMAERIGIAPVIYYSTATGLDYNDITDPSKNLDISNGSIWTTDKPADASTITAVAFDLSTGKDGEPYQFENRSEVNVEIIMDAPEELPADDSQIYAYNRPAYSSTYIPQGSVESTHMANIGKRVTVTLFDPQMLQFTKLGERLDSQAGKDAEDEPLGGVQFAIYKCDNMSEDHVHSAAPGSGSCWGTKPIWTSSSDEEGVVTFDNLDTGSYYFTEVDTPYAYVAPTGYWTFEVDARAQTVSSPVAHDGAPAFEGDAENGYTLTNELKKTRLVLIKAWSDGGTYQYNPALYRPDELTFDIYANGTLCRTVTLDKDQYNSAYMVENLQQYTQAGTLITYTVKERPVDFYRASPESVSSVYQQNYQLHSITNTSTTSALVITKQLASTTAGGASDKLFDFTVTLKDKSGNPITGTFPLLYTTASGSNNNGTPLEEQPATEITFDEDGVGHLKAGYNKRAHIYRLPKEGSYEIVESGMPTSDEGKGWWLYRSWGASGSLGAANSGNASYATFSNVYESYGRLETSLTKTLNGVNPAEMDMDGAFKFNVYALYWPGASNSQLVATGVNDGDQIKFTGTGPSGSLITAQMMGYSTVSYYAVTEDASVPAGVTRDARTIYLKVTWTDNKEGSLVPDVEYFSDRAFTTPLSGDPGFRNTMPLAGEGSIAAVKHLDGAAAPAGKFEFELVDEETGEVLEKASNAADGTVSFEKTFAFTQDDIGTSKSWLVREVAGSDNSISYDSTVWRATISPKAVKGAGGTWVLDCTPSYTVDGEDGEALDEALFDNFTLTSISGRKIWDDADNQDGKRPSSVSFKLQRLDEGAWVDVEGATATLEGDEQTYTFDGIPGKDASGNAVEYRVVETTEAAGYLATGGTAEEDYCITNSYSPETLGISGVKTWDDAELLEIEGYERPESIEVTLTGSVDGEAVHERTLTVAADDEGQWAYGWEGLPKYYRGSEIEWSVAEQVPAGYVAEQGEGEYDIVNVPLESIDSRPPAVIEVIKVDAADGGRLLPGAEFAIAGEDGTEIGTITTDSSGTALAEFTAPGTYTITETKAPAGYQNPKTVYTVEVSETGPVVSFDAEQQAWVHAYTLSAACADVSNGVLTVPDPKEPTPLGAVSRVVAKTGDFLMLTGGAIAVLLLGAGGVLLATGRRRKGLHSRR